MEFDSGLTHNILNLLPSRTFGLFQTQYTKNNLNVTFDRILTQQIIWICVYSLCHINPYKVLQKYCHCYDVICAAVTPGPQDHIRIIMRLYREVAKCLSWQTLRLESGVWSGVMLVLDFYRSHHTCSESVCRPELCKLPYAANILFTQYTTHQYQYLVIMSCGHSTQTCGEFEISFKFWISNKVVWVHRRYNIEFLPVFPAYISYIISIIYVETKWWWHMSCNVCYSVTHDLCNV